MNIEKKTHPVKRRKIIRRRTQSSATPSTYVGESLDTFPMDLIIEILKRLPTKTIAICRCVSKQWAFLLRSPQFTKSFLTCSSTRPRLLFTFKLGGKWHFFSSPQPRNVDDHVSVVAADYHMGISGNRYTEFSQVVNGFINIYENQMLEGKRKLERVSVLCNSSTGQLVHLPKATAKNKDLRSFFGYDPIENQFKVLCMTVTKYRRQKNSKEHHVLTIGKGKRYWRKIQCLVPHFPVRYRNPICIDGILYYIAWRSSNIVIACFDVKSEDFRFIKIEDDASYEMANFFALINYKRKLGLLVYKFGNVDQLWVLDDTEKEIWSKYNLCLPDIFFFARKSIWGTDMGEIVWAPTYWTHPFYVFYYNVERQSVRRVEIKGMKKRVFKSRDRPEAVFTFANHVENLMFLQ
ncbi:hypothetical protein N665_0420s0023 [Sinapis alba]|nr:hypothetical protein N665_0420s0023 [Sinapis alba]